MPTTAFSPQLKRDVLLLLGVHKRELEDGIGRYALEAGWVFDQIHAHGGLAPFWWRGDGMITLITHPKDYAVWRQLPKRPLVDLSKGWISNSMPPQMRRAGRGVTRVIEDSVSIARLAAAHFLERGFRHVALLNIGNFWMETERIPTFRQTLEAGGASYHEIPYYKHFSLHSPSPKRDQESTQRWLIEAIRTLPKPLGIFTSADDIAVMALRACNAAGVSVPEEVAVLGCDNQRFICDYAPVPLSSVDPDREQQGYMAAQWLDRLMNGEPPPSEPVIIPPKGVVTRQSTNILAVPHMPVARALTFIREHFRQSLQIFDIAKAAGMSRRGLEHAFRQHLHRSILDELTRCRIDHAKELLLTTELQASQIAARTGFSGLIYFSQTFKRTVGIGPREFRRQHSAGQ